MGLESEEGRGCASQDFKDGQKTSRRAEDSGAGACGRGEGEDRSYRGRDSKNIIACVEKDAHNCRG